MKVYFRKTGLLTALLISTLGAIAQTKKLSLQDAIQIAYKGNRQLQLKWLERERSGYGVKEAKSYLLPSVTLNGSYKAYAERPVIYLRSENSSPKVNDIKYGGRLAFDGNVIVNYPVWSPVIKSNIQIAKLNEQISQLEIKGFEDELTLSVAQLYLAVLMNIEQQKVLEQSLVRNERALNDSRSLFLQGKNLKTDTLSNYISVQNLKTGISALVNYIAVQSVQLKQLIGLEDGSELIYTDTLGVVEEAFTISGAGLSIALDNRKDVKIRDLQINLSKEQQVNFKAGFKPQLYATAQYQVQNQADDLRLSNYRLPRTSFAGVSLSVPIYSGNRFKYKDAQAQLAVKQNQVTLEDLKSNIQTELVSLNANLKQARDQWQIKRQNVDVALINYNMMTDRYRIGLASRLELSDAELALTKTKLEQLETIYSIRVIELQLKKAMGIIIN